MSPTRRMAVLSIATSLATLVLKFVAFGITGSIGLLSDALEALVNLAAGIVALTVLSIAERPADHDHAFGHEKAEYFSSGVEAVLILIAAVGIVWAATGRLAHPVPLHGLGPGLLVAAVAGALNLLAARLMLRAAARHDSITIEADARHLLADVWTSAGVIAGLLFVLARPGWAVADPLIAIAVSIHICWTGVSLLRRSVDGLMDRSLPPAEIEAAQEIIRSQLPAGAGYADLRTRKAGSRRFLEFKLRVPGSESVAAAHALCDRLEALLGRRLPNALVTIHVEPVEPERARQQPAGQS
ncbi:MAG TPA: cation diffusion facilitator family transporter [Steroidobacteraceae bacterium]|nr:cation diffusion facilitator family transporter [Steroidobacteraceae bacterium]